MVSLLVLACAGLVPARSLSCSSVWDDSFHGPPPLEVSLGNEKESEKKGQLQQQREGNETRLPTPALLAV